MHYATEALRESASMYRAKWLRVYVPVIIVALANDEGRSNGTNVRRIQLEGISYLL